MLEQTQSEIKRTRLLSIYNYRVSFIRRVSRFRENLKE